MSGPIKEMPTRICPYCGALYIEDAEMYEDTDRCPHCGKGVDSFTYGPDKDPPGI